MDSMTSVPESVSATNKSKATLVLGIIGALLVFAGLVYYVRQLRKLPAQVPASGIQALEEQRTSDEVAAIDKDLAGTDLGDLDKELGDIENELGAAPQ